jgi:hypothetical protein
VSVIQAIQTQGRTTAPVPPLSMYARSRFIPIGLPSFATAVPAQKSACATNVPLNVSRTPSSTRVGRTEEGTSSLDTRGRSAHSPSVSARGGSAAALKCADRQEAPMIGSRKL